MYSKEMGNNYARIENKNSSNSYEINELKDKIDKLNLISTNNNKEVFNHGC